MPRQNIKVRKTDIFDEDYDLIGNNGLIKKVLSKNSNTLNIVVQPPMKVQKRVVPSAAPRAQLISAYKPSREREDSTYTKIQVKYQN